MQTTGYFTFVAFYNSYNPPFSPHVRITIPIFQMDNMQWGRGWGGMFRNRSHGYSCKWPQASCCSQLVFSGHSFSSELFWSRRRSLELEVHVSVRVALVVRPDLQTGLGSSGNTLEVPISDCPGWKADLRWCRFWTQWLGERGAKGRGHSITRSQPYLIPLTAGGGEGWLQWHWL